MVASISEEILLQQAVAKGLLTERDIAQAQVEKPIPKRPIIWGPVLDQLVQSGKISDLAVREISADLSRTQKSAAAMARTLDGESLSPARSGDAAQVSLQAAAHHTQDQTLASLPSSGGAVSVQVTLGYPAPHWDKYEFLEVLGRGGMGTVYKARDRRLGRLAALKFIHGDDKGMTERFLQEARSQGRLAHPNICQVYEVGSVDGKPYIAMEYVDGQTLDRAGTLLSLQDKIQVFKDAADAVHAAHEQGVIHRDLKPSDERAAHGDGMALPTSGFGTVTE
jgi:hypothetical protein